MLNIKKALEDLQTKKTMADKAEQKSREKEQEIQEEMQKAEEEIQAIREVMVEVDYLREKEAKRGRGMNVMCVGSLLLEDQAI